MGPQSIQCPPTLAPPRCCWATPQAQPLLPPRPLTSLTHSGRAPVSSALASSTCWVSLRAADRPCSSGSGRPAGGAPSQPPAPPLGPLTSQCSQQVEDGPSQLLHQRPAAEHQALEDGARRTVQRLRLPGAQALLQLGTWAVSEPG